MFAGHRTSLLLVATAVALAVTAPSGTAQQEDIHHPPQDFSAKVQTRLDILGGSYPANPTWSDLQSEVGRLAPQWFNPDTGRPWVLAELLFAASAENAWIPDGPGAGERQRTQLGQVLDAMVWRRAYTSPPNAIDIPFQNTEGRGASNINGAQMCTTNAQGFWQPQPALISEWNSLYTVAGTTPAAASPGLGIGSRAEWGYSPSTSTNHVVDRIGRSFLVAGYGLGGGTSGPLVGVPIDRARVVLGRMFRTGPFQQISLDGSPTDPAWQATIADFNTAGTTIGTATPFEVEPAAPGNTSGVYRAHLDLPLSLLLVAGRAPEDPELLRAVRLRFRAEEPPPAFPTSGGPSQAECGGHASWSVNEINVLYREALPALEATAARDGVISGRVVDVDDVGIAGATVQAEASDGTTAGATTDSGGAYRITGLRGDDYTVSVLLPASQPRGGTLQSASCTPAAVTGGPPGRCRLRADGGASGVANFVYVLADAVVENVEITQGVQREAWGAPATVAVPDGTTPGARYTGVPLAENVPTVARVFVSGGNHHHITAAPNLTVWLKGYRVREDGGFETLRDSPLRRTVGAFFRSSFLPRTPILPGARLLEASSDIYTFALPEAWTRAGQEIVLVAEANPRLGGERLLPECAGCDRDNSFGLSDLSFRAMRSITITPAQVEYDFPGQSRQVGSDHRNEWDRVREVLPLAPKQLMVEAFPAAIVDLTSQTEQVRKKYDVKQPDFSDCLGDRTPDCRDALTGATTAALSRAMKPGGEGRYAFGYSAFGRSWAGPGKASSIIGTGSRRPLTALAHELLHLVGFEHASKSCGGDVNAFADWPPDQTGLIQGVGLDRAPGSGLFGTFRIIPGPGTFDLMSYCTAGVDSNAWISVRNWERFFRLNPAEKPLARLEAAGAVGGLGVDALVTRKGAVEIIGVGQDASAPVSKSERGGDYTVIVKGAGGKTVSRTSVDASEISDGAGGGVISVTVPGRGATAVEIRSGKKLAARRVASNRRPRVTLIGPRRGALRRAKTLTVRWRVRGARPRTVTARVEFSADNGRRWRTLAAGITGSRVKLKGSMLRTTRRGRIRVVVNDGFNDASARSGRLRVAR